MRSGYIKSSVIFVDRSIKFYPYESMLELLILFQYQIRIEKTDLNLYFIKYSINQMENFVEACPDFNKENIYHENTVPRQPLPHQMLSRRAPLTDITDIYVPKVESKRRKKLRLDMGPKVNIKKLPR